MATLFVQLVLKTYVPDELSGLVDALADPKAYLSAQEKRTEALQHMGIDDSDIVEVAPTAANASSNERTRIEPQRRQDLKQKLNGMPQNFPMNEYVKSLETQSSCLGRRETMFPLQALLPIQLVT